VSAPPTPDPERLVTQPVARALDGLIVGGALSFALSIATVLTAVVGPAGVIHEIAHVLLLGFMGLVVLGRALHLLRRRSVPGQDVWARAYELLPGDARLARILTFAVPLAWLAGNATILVHHMPHLTGAGLAIGAWLPMSAVLWILATFSWQDFSRDRVGAALDESERRFRGYWRDIAGSG
jgi:hypothetical protein